MDPSQPRWNPGPPSSATRNSGSAPPADAYIPYDGHIVEAEGRRAYLLDRPAAAANPQLQLRTSLPLFLVLLAVFVILLAFTVQIASGDDTTVKFEIWDTTGQERYHSLAPMYYRGAQAAIVVYDITNQESFAKAKKWAKELQRQASPNIVIALSGIKADLAAKRVVEYEEAQAYADDNGLLFMETSAESAMNVNDVSVAIAKRLPKNKNGGGPSGQGQGGVNINEEQPQ